MKAQSDLKFFSCEVVALEHDKAVGEILSDFFLFGVIPAFVQLYQVHFSQSLFSVNVKNLHCQFAFVLGGGKQHIADG